MVELYLGPHQKYDRYRGYKNWNDPYYYDRTLNVVSFSSKKEGYIYIGVSAIMMLIFIGIFLFIYFGKKEPFN